MEQKINSWFESFSPGYSNDGRKLNVEAMAAFSKAGEIPEMPASVPTPPEADEFSFSYPALSGKDKMQLLQADQEIAKAYAHGGASDPIFLEKFEAAPVTGMATLLNYVQIQKEFIPHKGKLLIEEFGHFISSVVACPACETGAALSLNHDTIINVKKKHFDHKEIIDNIAKTYELNEEQRDEIQAKLQGATSNSVKLTIYNMQISGSSIESFFGVFAGVVIITRTQTRKIMPRFQFEINFRGNKLVTSIQKANWVYLAPNLAKMHFASIPEWIKANEPPTVRPGESLT